MKEKNYNLYIFILLIILFILFPLFNKAKGEKGPQKKVTKVKGITINVWIDKSQITIGDKIKFHIQIIHSPKYKVIFPEFGDKLEKFIIRDFHELPIEEWENNKIKEEQIYILETYVTGKYIIPSLEIKYYKKDNKNNIKKIKTSPLYIEVISITTPEELEKGPKDIKDIVDIPIKTNKNYLWLWIFILVLILGIILFIIIKKYRQQKQQKHIKIILPHEKALKEIELLKNIKVETQEQIKNFYIKISNIVRKYIEERFNIKAIEMTTQEFLRYVTNTEILDKKYTKLLEKFLQECDLVKFAKYGPTPEERKNILKSAEDFIINTKPEPEENKLSNEENNK